jgi:hypothetical protein
MTVQTRSFDDEARRLQAITSRKMLTAARAHPSDLRIAIDRPFHTLDAYVEPERTYAADAAETRCTATMPSSTATLV